jgi:Na+-driven multidrug efflux pump
MSTPGAYVRPSLNRIAVPIVGEFLLGISVAMAGLYMASHTSDAAAGAFGLTQQVQESLAVIFRVLAIGLGVVVTQKLGSNNHLAATKTAFLALGAATWAGLIAMLCMLLGHSWILDTLNAPAEVVPLAAVYMMLLAPAMVLEVYNLSMAAVLRAHLFAKESLFVMLSMHGSHLLLAWVLMLGVGPWTGMGLNGFAIAWLISRALGLALHLRFWRLRMHLVPQRAHWWQAPVATLMPVLRVGLPGAAVEFFYRVSFMVSISATAKLGVAALATHSYTLQTLKYVLLISLSIGWACEIMVGRMVGAGHFKGAYNIIVKGVRSGMVASGALVLAAAIAAPWLMRLFTQDPDIIRTAQVLLWMSVLLELGRVFNLVVIGALRASGDIHYPVVGSVASLVLILGVGSYWFGQWFGLYGIWAIYVIDECVRGLLMWRRWQTLGWLHNAKQTVRRLRSDKLEPPPTPITTLRELV